MADYYLLQRNGARDGPYSEEDLLDLLDADELSAGALCEEIDTGRCVRVRDLFKVIPPANDDAPYPDLPPPPVRISPAVSHSPFPKTPAAASGSAPAEFSPWRPAPLAEAPEEAPPARLPRTGRICFRGHPSLLLYWRSVLPAVALAAGGWFAGAYAGKYETPALTAGLGGGLLLLTVLFLRRAARRYLITTRHVERQDGLLSVSSREVRLEDIRAINVTKTGLRGLLGVGTVNFSTAAGDADDVVFQDVPHAHDLKELVRRLQDRLE